ncbi:hypothetical protein CTI12_AA301500 [Artemisia annua]|uniref:RBR-type E3 ubiquitin transferase n=1 Tax=Artemisia annua TaxID=35608 RepID=A0A2U1N6N8_ARTAN|nr:hypothetical protein CTI12_AA301500 [Artemisia annua]
MGNDISITQQEPQNHRQEDQKYAFTCEMCFKPVYMSNKEVENNNKLCTDCMIKYEEQNKANGKFKNSNICVHPFCTDCMIRYIQVKVEEKVSDIRCPDTSCKYSLEPLSCRSIITNQLFDKWCDVLCESAVLGVDGVYCPNRECMELILNECGDHKMKRCVCPYCKKPFCFGCKVPWHDGYSCKESKKMMMRDENDVAFDLVYKKNKWQMYPKCRHCVERVNGCNCIRCSVLVLGIRLFRTTQKLKELMKKGDSGGSVEMTGSSA